MHEFKERLKGFKTLIGPLVTLPSPDVAEILARVGFDYLWIETEHGPMDFAHVQSLVQAVGGRCPTLVRIPAREEMWIKKALDTGCDGIIVPQVRSAQEARRIVEWSLYPPAGHRSVGVSRAHGYGMTFGEYVAGANDELVIVLQIENDEAVANIESILEVEKIDALLVGPFDLSGSLGLLGETNHPRVLEAVETVRGACEAAGMPLGIFCADASTAMSYLAQGFSLIAVGMDSFFLWRSARNTLSTLRESSV